MKHHAPQMMLPGLDHTEIEVVECSGHELSDIMHNHETAGWTWTTADRVGNAGYRLRFERRRTAERREASDVEVGQ